MEEITMNKLKLLGAAAILAATVSSPVLAQQGVIGPGSRYGLQPEPGPTYDQGYQRNGFGPFDAGGAAPSRAMNGSGSYDMMQTTATARSAIALTIRSREPSWDTTDGGIPANDSTEKAARGSRL
jgi:hypothetical protein